MEQGDCMKKLLLITGDLATGKSTFSNVLAKRYQITVFQKDSIKEVLGDYIGFANREENLKLSRTTMGLMFYIFEQFTKQGKALILEANFHEEELKRLHEIAGENGYQILTLVLRGIPSFCISVIVTVCKMRIGIRFI